MQPGIIIGGLIAFFLWSNKDTVLTAVSNSVTINDASMQTFKTAPPDLLKEFRMAEQYYDLPYRLLERMAWQESRYDLNAVSSKGAMGIMQFMPATANGGAGFGIGVFDPFDAPMAISMAGKYIRALYNRTGSWALALAAYNWGIGNVEKYGIASAPLETKNYVAAITKDIGIAYA